LSDFQTGYKISLKHISSLLSDDLQESGDNQNSDPQVQQAIFDLMLHLQHVLYMDAADGCVENWPSVKFIFGGEGLGGGNRN
jgi:hypothetical protein